MSDPYQLTSKDVDRVRVILAELEELDRQVGGYDVGAIQGNTRSATVTVHFAKAADALTTARAIERQLNSAGLLGLLCRKIVAHAETHPSHIAGSGRDE